MVFTSVAFVKFFAIVFAGLLVLRSREWRQLLILVASCFFYAYWAPPYLLVLLTPSVAGYYCGLRIESASGEAARKRWLAACVVVNLGLLSYFKYTNFFIATVAGLLRVPAPHLHIVLPVGLSFYTFKILSYAIDVYRRELPACRSLWRYAMYASYFPELVAGPIVRASIFLPQMRRPLRFSLDRFLVGGQIVLLGVTKKLLIADQLSLLVDPVFAHPAVFSSYTVLEAVIAYSIQIYCDFSGYSDIAIGVSKIIGFDLPENFNLPYLSTSVVEFWRRWHITLSNWLRDYLFFSLGGLRANRFNRYRNLLITMFLGGLWHGASWTFVVWGLLHGGALCVNQWLDENRRRKQRRPSSGLVPRLLNWGLTYAFVCFTWVFFRSRDFSTAGLVLRKLCWLDAGGVLWHFSPLYIALPLLAAGHLIGSYGALLSGGRVQVTRVAAPSWLARFYRPNRQPFAVRPHQAGGLYVLIPFPTFAGGFLVTVWILVLALFFAGESGPFIYFQF